MSRMWWALILFLSPISAEAIQVRELGIHYRLFHTSARMFEIYGFKPKEAVNLLMNVDLGYCFYWDNTIKSLTDDGGYRGIAWNYRLGCRVLPSLRVEYEHLSQHYIDHDQRGYPGGRFPVQDSVGLYWTLILSPRGRSIFE